MLGILLWRQLRFLSLLVSAYALTSPRLLPNRSFLSASDFTFSVTQWLTEANIRWFEAERRHERLLLVVADTFFLHLVPSPRSPRDSLAPRYCQSLTESFAQHDPSTTVVHLHEDVWVDKRKICQSRLLVKCGHITKRYFARKTTARRINGLVAREFLGEHHLWGFTRAKYYYGLYVAGQTTNLVAVASFSSCKKVLRDNVHYKSHELIRFCTERNTSVVGGISKLVQAFVRDVQPDDIITVVDRDWGTGRAWHSLGFVSCHVMPPLLMAVGQNDGIRRYLLGAGIRNPQEESLSTPLDGTTRLGLPDIVLEQLERATYHDDAILCLYRNGCLPVYDSGVERLMMLVNSRNASLTLQGNRDDAETVHTATTKRLWTKSATQYASKYYSPNRGIALLLQNVQRDVNFTFDFPLDSIAEHLSLRSWHSSSQLALPVFETCSSLDPTSKVKIIQRAHGWHTVGIAGGLTKSIWHGVYRTDEDRTIRPSELGPVDYIRSMAALVLTLSDSNGINQRLRILHFGLGAGSLARFLSHYLPDSTHVVVELDRGVVKAARQMSLLNNTNIRVVCEDALQYQRDFMEEPYDCICIDIFDANNLLPEGFYAVDFLEHLSHNMLTRKGTVLHNFHLGTPSLGKQLNDARVNYSSVFSCCRTVPVGTKMFRNEILVATNMCDGDSYPPSTDHEAAESIQQKLRVPFDCRSRIRGLDVS